MKIAASSAFHFDLPLRFTFKHAGAGRRRNDTLILRLTDQDGRCGFGEALPRSYLTGETSQTILQFWTDWIQSDLKAPFAGPLAVFENWLNEELHKAEKLGALSAWGAIDLACRDLRARQRRYSLLPGTKKRFDGQPMPPPTLTFGLGSPAKLVRLATIAGVRSFKFKVGTSDPINEARTLRQLVNAAGTRSEYRLDLNRGYSFEEALQFFKALGSPGDIYFEDPCRDGSALPGALCMADEILLGPGDGQKLSQPKSFQAWNLRVGKNGGIGGVKLLAKEAIQNGIMLCLGSLVGQSMLLERANAHVGWQLPWRWRESSYPNLLLKYSPFEDDRSQLGFGLKLQIKNQSRYLIKQCQLKD